MLDWYWRRLGTFVRAEVAPLVAAAEARQTTAFAEASRVLLRHLDERVAGLHEEADRRAALTMARWEAVDRRLETLLAATDLMHRQLAAAVDAGVTTTLAAVSTAEARLVAHHDAAVQAGLAKLGSGPGTVLAAKLTAWMGTPAWQAVLYAVQKSAHDTSLHDNALRRSQALEWARRWLRESGHPTPTDRTLNLLIELALLERKGAEPVPWEAP